MGNLLDCGGVKMLARMVWGTYAVKIEVQMDTCLIVEGSKMLARMVWGTYAVKIEVQMGICLIVGGLKSLPGWFGALITIQQVDLKKLLNSVRK